MFSSAYASFLRPWSIYLYGTYGPRGKRIALAQESHDPRVLDELAWDRDPLIRAWVSLNKFTTQATLKRLCKDPLRDITRTAQRALWNKYNRPALP